MNIEIDHIYNMDCLWKRIGGFEDKYLVSNKGDVYSIRSRKILRPIDNSGYLKVMFGRKMYRIHRLVAAAFLDNPQNYKCVNHIDGDKHNNKVENLEWCNHSMNLIHAYRHLLNHNEKPVDMLKNGIVIKKYRSAVEAEKDGFQCRLIAKCCKGLRKHHKGYEWRYSL